MGSSSPKVLQTDGSDRLVEEQLRAICEAAAYVAALCSPTRPMIPAIEFGLDALEDGPAVLQLHPVPITWKHGG